MRPCIVSCTGIAYANVDVHIDLKMSVARAASFAAMSSSHIFIHPTMTVREVSRKLK